MKSNRIILSVLAALSLTSCSFLDFSESTGKSEDYIYSYMEQTVAVVNEMYSHLPNDFGLIGESLRESSTDNLCMVRPEDPINDYFNGGWSQIRALDNVWGEYYGVIRNANSFLENFDITKYDKFYLDPNYDEVMIEMAILPYEARFLRAYYYFELAKRYRNIPLILDVVDLEDVNHLEPVGFDEIADFVVKECDAICDSLPDNYSGMVSKQTGRATKGAALALKNRTQLYLASPLFCPEKDVEKYKTAAKSAKAVIDYGKYSIKKGEKLFGVSNDMLRSKQLIFERRNGSSSSFESANSPVAYEGVGLGKANCPTQNLVECFDMKDGSPFPEWAVGEERTDPFKNLDPRFYETVMYDGISWMNENVEIFAGGKNGQDKEYSTRTGYYLMKHMNPGTDLTPGKHKAFQHHSFIFRYAEILFNYAEAMNEAFGPEYTDAEFKMSALEALNMVRVRVGMPDFPAGMSQDEFRTVLRKEKRVEFAVENQYFWDIRRWKVYGDAPAEIPIYGAKVYKNDEGKVVYKKYLVETRHWDPKMYFYPIPLSELKTNTRLQQNPGW